MSHKDAKAQREAELNPGPDLEGKATSPIVQTYAQLRRPTESGAHMKRIAPLKWSGLSRQKTGLFKVDRRFP